MRCRLARTLSDCC